MKPPAADRPVSLDRQECLGAARRREEGELEAALARLPELYRQVILLRHREHCSFADIGRAMRRSEDAVHKLWVRAVEQLHRELGDAHEPDPSA
jgi:DNA-directed RNA polymerase specialized sigma24 family protein